MTTTITLPNIRRQPFPKSCPSTPPPRCEIRDFRPCYESLLQSLPFARLRWDECRDRDAVTTAFHGSWQLLEVAATTDLHRMVQATYRASVDDRTTAKIVNLDELAAQDASRILRHATPFIDGSDATHDIAKDLEPAAAFQVYARALGNRAADVIARYRYALDMLRETGIAGSVQFGRRECVFTYARTVLTDVERDRSEQSSEEVSQEFGVCFNRTIRTETTHSQATIETAIALQTLCPRISYPETHPAPAPHVSKPARIKKHEAAVPFFMKPTYITGDLLDVTVTHEPLGSRLDPVLSTTQRRQIEWQLNRANLIRAGVIAGTAALTLLALPLFAIGTVGIAVANDPALVVGNGRYVISGWLPEEVPVEGRFRIQRS